MKKNMGTTDKTIRITIAVLIIAAWLAKILTGTTAIVLLVLAGIFIVTSLISFCPLYKIVGINTCPRQQV